MDTQFVTDNQGKKLAVILPIDEYEELLDRIEEIEDVSMYDAVKARQEKTIPLTEYIKKRKRG